MYIEYPLSDQEVLGSKTPVAKSHHRLTNELVLTFTLCDAPQIKILRMEIMRLHMYATRKVAPDYAADPCPNRSCLKEIGFSTNTLKLL